MHNMSSQLYKYVSNLIFESFSLQKIEPGERFNLYLERQENIQNLYEALGNNPSWAYEKFNYIHPEGGEVYETFCIVINDTKVIIASSEFASEDYFTMLRNKVADQIDVFAGTAILILFSGKLDSLLGGSGSLIKEGMPLHFTRFKNKIEFDVENNSSLKKHEKAILKFILERKTKSVVEDNNTIFDYEQVINSLEKGKIDLEDYKGLGLFPHNELPTKSEPLKDLDSNFILYEKFENIFLNGNPSVILEPLLPDFALERVVKEDWHEFDFATLTKWMEKEKEKLPPTFLSVGGDNLIQTIWYRTDGDSISKNRNINVIVFNPSSDFPFKINVKYDQAIKKVGLNIKHDSKNIRAIATGHNIVLEFARFNPDEVFTLVDYKDPATDKRYNIKVMLLPFQPYVLSQFETNFQLKVSKSESYLLVKESKELIFNSGAESIVNDVLAINGNYNINSGQELRIKYDSSISQEDLILFNVGINKTNFPIAIKSDFEALKPITGLEVWKEKRVHGLDYKFIQEEDTIKLVFKNNEKTVSGDFRHNLIQEKQIINSDEYSWLLHNDNLLTGNIIELEAEVKTAFDNLRAYYRHKALQPSLVYINDELKQLSIDYLSAFIHQLESFTENMSLSLKQQNLLWLGVVKENIGEHKIKFTPLHPLNVAYQLLINDKLKNEDVYNAILKRLNAYNLVPYLQGKNDEIYLPIESSHSPEWLSYTTHLNSKQAASKSFVAKLVADKIKDFTTNFQFLFGQSNSAPVKINVINLGDCKEVVKGLFEYYRAYLNSNENKRPTDLLPVEVSIYGSEKFVTKFEELTFYEKVEDIKSQLEVELSTRKFEKEDLLNAFLEKVNFYSKKLPIKAESYEYAHITFFQFDINETKTSYDDMRMVKTGISMDGLMSDVCSTPTANNYRTGYGLKDLPEVQSEIMHLSTLLNAFVRVATNGNPYERNKALATTINYDVKIQLEKLYLNSQWVTYIDPKVDLDFFKENKDLVIIHYSDQYNNSNGYDAITVSRKTSQYEFVVKEFLEKHAVQFDATVDTIQIINFFNAINGEWLLKLIRQHSHFPKEKLSLLSGIKSALTFLHNQNIIWIPISLEEILRVSGNAGLDMSEGLFSTKNLGAIGSFSDDLLLIGLEWLDDKLLMHFYPVELKIGGLGMVKKGINQSSRTAHLLYEHLTKEGFLGEFYKNFFAKIAINNAEKMKLFHVWDNQNWDLVIENYRRDLLSNNFIISNRLDSSIGRFGLIHFGNDVFQRKIRIADGFMRVDLLEADGFNFLVKSIDDLIHLFHETETTIVKNSLLINSFSEASKEVFTPYELEEEIVENIKEENEIVNVAEDKVQNGDNKETASNDIIDVRAKIAPEVKSKASSVINSEEGIKIVFGTDLGSSKPIIWEPNNTNKVMHTNTGIIGTMGTGKTQFTKSLITQLYENSDKNIGNENLGILIFDYKGDYIKDDFVDRTNAKVFTPYHLPYNPLALDATQISKPMLPLHTANDIKETISNAFNLGNVQKQRLRDVIVEAYENKGINKANKDTWSKTPPTLGEVCDIYLGNEKASQDSLYAAISNLSEFEIFEPDATKTQSLYSLIEGVVVINLSGYDESIQNLIVAITLDAFYTQMQRHGHSDIKGHNRQIKKMILVDEADNFLSKNFNSIRKILKEGREFGVGTILSTQFLNHFATSENEYSNYILTWVIHRVNEIKIKEVDSLFSLESKSQRENLIKTIKGLEKHQSIVNLAGSDPILIKDKAFWELFNN
jgi:DNA phosphorothioation-dependent restriction protein DptH